MKEYIEREALWRAMQSIIEDPTCPLHIAATVDQYITEAPAADVVEHKRGVWVGTADGYADGELVYDMWECSECGYDADGAEERPEWNFCPKCGADMRGNNHETDIEAQPAVDVVEIVRCGQCMNWDTDKLYCHSPAGMSWCGEKVAKEGFCCFGERRNHNDHP